MKVGLFWSESHPLHPKQRCAYGKSLKVFFCKMLKHINILRAWMMVLHKYDNDDVYRLLLYMQQVSLDAKLS